MAVFPGALYLGALLLTSSLRSQLGHRCGELGRDLLCHDRGKLFQVLDSAVDEPETRSLVTVRA